MKKIVLIVTLSLTSFSLLSFNSLGNENLRSTDTENLIVEDYQEDECQEYAFSIIRTLYEHSSFTLQELADYESFLLASCYYEV
ncbi:hypothetical protein [Tenacibaculum sp.]|uniref:hypothetical protein n=1 Tax=Tenacibaculum sp. TaxID=1906242 RepID=UPI003AA7FDFA